MPLFASDITAKAAFNRHVSLLRSEMSVMQGDQRRLDAIPPRQLPNQRVQQGRRNCRSAKGGAAREEATSQGDITVLVEIVQKGRRHVDETPQTAVRPFLGRLSNVSSKEKHSRRDGEEVSATMIDAQHDLMRPAASVLLYVLQ